MSLSYELLDGSGSGSALAEGVGAAQAGCGGRGWAGSWDVEGGHGDRRVGRARRRRRGRRAGHMAAGRLPSVLTVDWSAGEDDSQCIFSIHIDHPLTNSRGLLILLTYTCPYK